MRLDNSGDVYTAPDSGTSTGTTGTTGVSAPVASGSVSGSGAVSGGGGLNIGGITVKVAAADTPVQCQPLRVNPGERVYIRPLPGNTKPVQVAQYALGAQYGPFDYMAPGDTEREFPVDNTGHIFVAQPAAAFVAGEGIAVNIRRPIL